jgi:hypothetical protein
MVGTMMTTNYGGWPQIGSRVPAGRLLVLDDETVYGFGRSQYIHHGAHVGIDGATIYHFNATRDAERRFTHYQAFAISRQTAGADGQAAKPASKKRPAPARGKQYRWTRELPVLARAMVLAGDQLILAGPPDIFGSDEPAAALAGTKGGLLCLLSTTDGEPAAQYRLDSPPVFDGMAVADKCLYMATLDGHVVCLGDNR